MNPRLIDANYLIAEFTDRARAARNWKVGAINSSNEEAAIRADAVLSFLTEVKLTIDNAPTINDKAYAIGYAAGSREGYKKGIEDARPKGIWLESKKAAFGLDCFICTNCHTEIKDMPTAMRTPIYNFCPNCGAKMKRRQGGSKWQ